MLVYVDDIGRIVVQMVKYLPEARIGEYLNELKALLLMAIDREMFNVCWAGIMTMSESIDYLCQYGFSSLANEMVQFFKAIATRQIAVFPDSKVILARHTDYAIERLLKSTFVDNDLRKQLAN